MAGDQSDRPPKPLLPDLPFPSDPDLVLPDLGGGYRPRIRPDLGAAASPSARSRATPQPRPRDDERPLPPLALACTVAAPYLVATGLAFVPGSLYAMVPLGSIPLALMLIVVSQVAIWWVARGAGAVPLDRIGLMNAIAIAIVLPALAVQAAAARTPYVSSELGTARVAILATVAAVVVVVAVAVLGGILNWQAPPQASLQLLPIGVLVPLMLGGPFEPSVDEVSRIVGEAFLVCAVATFAAALVPSRVQFLIAPLSVAALFVGLLVLDRGPVFDPSSGTVVRVLDVTLLAVTIVCLVAAPILALLIDRVGQEIRRGVFPGR